MTDRRMECEWCTRLASHGVHAWWGMFDWDDAECCEAHVEVAVRRFWNRLVDGKKPIDVWSTPIYLAQGLDLNR